jgi:outer membrane protein TolC
MGVDVRSAFHIKVMDEPAEPVPTEDQALSLAMERRPEMCRDVAQVVAARADVKAAATSNKPTITASANYTPNPGSRGFVVQQTGSFLLGFQWNFLDFGATRGAVQQARSTVKTAEEDLYNDKQTIASELTQARENITAAQTKYDYALAEVASAQLNVESAVGSFQAGVGIFLNVIDAQALLLKAQVDQATARYELSIARAMLQHATGGAGPYEKKAVENGCPQQ